LAGALIVLAALAKPDFAWLEALRRRHYPPDRNRVPAHLTMVHALPPSAEPEVRRSLARAVQAPPPRAELSGVMDLDSGVALRVHSPGLELIREALAAEFRGLLSAQDSGRWSPHVTIQNKADPKVARGLVREMRAGFEPRPLKIAGLQLVRYLDGGWEPLGSWSFRGT
jgi:2'-5' RNA ligase superfamily